MRGRLVASLLLSTMQFLFIVSETQMWKQATISFSKRRFRKKNEKGKKTTGFDNLFYALKKKHLLTNSTENSPLLSL